VELTLRMAQAMINRAIDTATSEYKRPICVSVCDAAGLLMAFCRVEGGNFRSVDISQAKAYTAVRMVVDTDAFLERLQRENLSISYFCDAKMTALPGGVVVRNSAGSLIGGIGISGLKADEDAVVARAAAELAKVL
jgi:glc operon protein GlcG